MHSRASIFEWGNRVKSTLFVEKKKTSLLFSKGEKKEIEEIKKACFLVLQRDVQLRWNLPTLTFDSLVLKWKQALGNNQV